MPNSSVSSAGGEKELKGILRNSKRTSSPPVGGGDLNGQGVDATTEKKKRTKSVHMDEAVTKVQIHS